MTLIELQYFDVDEFHYYDSMDHTLLRTLDFVRGAVGDPFYITSDFRLGDDGLHGEGRAVDWATDISRDRAKYAYQEQMWRVSGAVHEAKRLHITNMRNVQLELVQGPNDWHFHLGLYPVGSFLESKIIIALD